MKKKKKKSYRLIYLLLLLIAVILIGVLAFAIYKLNTEFIPQQQEAQRYDDLRDIARGGGDKTDPGDPTTPRTIETTSTGAEVPVYTLEELFAMNSDMVGWLTIPDTLIDYPVMHTPYDVEYYLHTDFDGYYSFSGCLFVGDNCDIDSDVYVIYGHNMNNGTMFGELDLFTYYDYWQEHPDVILQTREGTRLYRIFAAFATKVYDKDDKSTDFRYYQSVGNRTKAEYDSILSEIDSLSVLPTGEQPSYPAQILYLSTCAYHEENGRFVVAAYRIG